MKAEALVFEADSVILPRIKTMQPATPAMTLPEHAVPVPPTEVVSTSRLIMRFRKSERMLHWAIAVPFMVCYASAMILMFGYNLHSESISRDLFSWIHRISGACLLCLPTLTVLKHVRDYSIHLHNIRQGWVWAIDDLKWLILFGAAAVSRKVKLPEQGKFNAAEKLNFMMVMCACPLFGLTGLILMAPGPAFLSWVIHAGLALIVTPLMLGHIFMAVVNPGTRVGLSGMFSGYVDREWAKHHYRRWFRENFENVEKADREHEKIRQAMQHPVLVRYPRCRNEHVVASWQRLLESVCAFRPFTCPDCRSVIDAVEASIEPGEGDSILLSLEKAGIRHFVVEKSPEVRLPMTPVFAGESMKDSR